ncbi:hypothetical protein Pr1d_20990 [Bythopirellula goksoeyrii]|uniref:Uncharacterized protein n=1 Tax=Bythopirellula goksoeyrii TaxID=1400387 RepID=A0A5B9Q719_9BACT|nr:hypothetical protein Pr1d_20990 [Bythopirellula goksoeyrii]
MDHPDPSARKEDGTEPVSYWWWPAPKSGNTLHESSGWVTPLLFWSEGVARTEDQQQAGNEFSADTFGNSQLFHVVSDYHG